MAGVFRFWQKGPDYDRNLGSEATVLASIDYIHTKPVVRGLVRHTALRRWSSACRYASERKAVDGDLPRIDGLPAEFF